jgi:hypothetical protein
MDAMVDCIATAPHTKNDAYSQKTNKITFWEPFPNLYKIIQKSSIKGDSNQPVRQHFFDGLRHCITEIIHHGFISKKVLSQT